MTLPDTLPASVGLNMNFLQILSSLMRCPSVVGAEHSFMRILQRELEARGANVIWYEGLLVAQGNRPDSLYLSAHIDRHGLICTGPNEFQYAAFVASNRSDLLGNSASELLMERIAGRFENTDVYAYEPWSGAYIGKGMIENSYICPTRHNLIFNVGGLEGLVAGTPIAFDDQLHMTDSTIMGQMDNVLSVALQVYLFEIGFEGTAFFTCQEEAGKSWRYVVEWFRRFGGNTDNLLVLDTSPFETLSEAEKYDLVLRNLDANAVFDAERTKAIADTIQQDGHTMVFKDDYIETLNKTKQAAGQSPYPLGATELGRIINASGGQITGTTLQMPSTGYHTMRETVPIKSVVAMIDVLEKLMT